MSLPTGSSRPIHLYGVSKEAKLTEQSGIEHFKQAAATWDNPERVALLKGYADKIKTHLTPARARKILEIGCGTGLLGANFVDAQNEILGIDTSKEMLEVFRQKYPGNPRVRTQLFNIEEQDLAETGFDLVISSMTFHHLQNPVAVLRKIRSILAPEGLVAVIDLDKEDGTFHADPQKMGVKHFGFSRDTLAGWAQEAGFSGFTHEIIHTLEKESGLYPIFLAVYE